MREINLNVYPKDGYIFRDADGFVHHATSWKKLTLAVVDYRARNGFPAGEPYAEIMNQQCAKTPGLCNEQSTPDPTGMSFTQHVLAWLAHAAGYKRIGKWNRIDDATAASRAAICAVCPNQRALSTACGACITSIKALRTALLDGTKPKHQNLDPCSVLFEDCQSTVHVDPPPVSAADNAKLPAQCWRRL